MTTLSYRTPRRAPIVPRTLIAVFGGLSLFFTIVIVWTVGFQLLYAGRIFPGVSIAGVELSGLTPNEAAVKLNQTLAYPYNGKIVLRDGERIWVVTPAQMGMAFDASSSAQAAYQLGRSNGLFASLDGQLRARSQGAEIAPVILFDQRVAYQYLQALASEVNQPVVEAGLKIDGTNVVAIASQAGRILDVDGTLVFLTAQMQSFRDGEIPLVVREQQPKILDVSAQAEVARRILSQPMRLSIPNSVQGDAGPWNYDVQILANMLIVQQVDVGDTVEVQVALDPAQLRELLLGIATRVDRSSENARFYFDDGTRELVLIKNATIGRALDISDSIAAINAALVQGQHDIPLVIVESQPEVPDTALAVDLGITALVSSETSFFYGSSSERIQNIQAAAERFHGLLVAPGETFSMGDAMGDVSLDNGFAEALIIYGGRTIKGVGGGVCQVSTTLFRTVFFGGYPVVERIPHAYRVSYYELTASGYVDTNLAGLDATVYFPLVDFKFTNDTPYWILMETYVSVEGRSLTWKFYSTNDGRSVTWETTGPLNVVQAPKPLFEVSDELNEGQIKQIDWAANGADVVVTRSVWKNGAVYFSDQFKTSYEPWQAVCEIGPGTEEPEKLAKRKNLCLSPNS